MKAKTKKGKRDQLMMFLKEKIVMIGLLGTWYGFNIFYNIYNKQVMKVIYTATSHPYSCSLPLYTLANPNSKKAHSGPLLVQYQSNWRENLSSAPVADPSVFLAAGKLRNGWKWCACDIY